MDIIKLLGTAFSAPRLSLEDYQQNILNLQKKHAIDPHKLIGAIFDRIDKNRQALAFIRMMLLQKTDKTDFLNITKTNNKILECCEIFNSKLDNNSGLFGGEAFLGSSAILLLTEVTIYNYK